jgi:hypothetical protein
MDTLYYSMYLFNVMSVISLSFVKTQLPIL